MCQPEHDFQLRVVSLMLRFKTRWDIEFPLQVRTSLSFYPTALWFSSNRAKKLEALHLNSLLPNCLVLALERDLLSCWKFLSISHLQFSVFPSPPTWEGAKLEKQPLPTEGDGEPKPPSESNSLSPREIIS